MQFKELKVLRVDEIRTYKPDPEQFLYNVYFELSTVPPSNWVQIFEQEHHFPQHTMLRRAWINGRHVVVQCLLSEVQDGLREVKKGVTKTNQKYREYLRQQSVNKEKERNEREKIKKALSDLEFE